MNLHQLIKEPQWVIGALLSLHNSAFSYFKTDHLVFSNMVQIYQNKKKLNDNQIAVIRRRIVKYKSYLQQLDIQPVKILSGNIKSAIFGDSYIRCRMSKQIQKDKQIISAIRLMDDPSYHPSTKTWSVALTHQNVDDLQQLGFEIDPAIYDWYDTTNEFNDDFNYQAIEGIKKNPFPYQIDGVKFIDQMNGRALIADEMGLGKTCQALLWIHIHSEISKILIVCPASVKYNWQKEIDLWTTLSDEVPIMILNGKKATTISKNFEGIIIINYDILSNWKYQLSKFSWDVIIGDEIHKVKNKKAKRTKAMISLAKKSLNFIGLSGTPVTNRPIDFFYILNMIKPGLFSSRWDYAIRYCGAKHNNFGWDFNGASNTEELYNILKTNVMIRRKKEEVLKDLPPKIRIVIPLQIDNQKLYNEAETNIIAYLKNHYVDNEWIKKIEKTDTKEDKEKSKKSIRAKFLVQAEKLKQLAIQGKMKQVINWIDDYLESGEKLVVFTRHKDVLKQLYDKYKKIAVKLDGDVTGLKKQKVVDDFQNNKIKRLFFGNLKACSEAITLTAAKATCTIEFDWFPGIHDQAEDRIHRIGQKADCVYAYYLIAKDTIEERIANLIDKKRDVLNQLLDGQNVQESQLLMNLMGEMSGDYNGV